MFIFNTCSVFPTNMTHICIIKMVRSADFSLQAWCSILSINYTIPEIGLEISYVVTMSLLPPSFRPNNTAVVPRHLSLCNWPHKTAPQATSLLPSVPAEVQEDRLGPIKLTGSLLPRNSLSARLIIILLALLRSSRLSLLHYSHTAKDTAKKLPGLHHRTATTV